MLSTNVGGVPGLDLLLQQRLLPLCREQEQKNEKRKTIVRGVPWLRDPTSEPKAAKGGTAPEIGSWTCPRCRSHRCIRVNPGNVSDPVYRCAVCGYTFRKASAMRLRDPGLVLSVQTRAAVPSSAAPTL